MILGIKQYKNKYLEGVYERVMKELGDFYGINWVKNRPRFFVLKSRKEMDLFKGRKTEDWLVGSAGNGEVTVLERSKIKKESSHKEGYSKKAYEALIKHEFGHLFFRITVGGSYHPLWLNEGLSIYVSGQNEFKVVPEKFAQFLSFYDVGNKDGKSVYTESGFFIEMLVEKFGKKKLIDFLRSLQGVKDKKEFDNLFLKTYGFKLNYREINKEYKSEE